MWVDSSRIGPPFQNRHQKCWILVSSKRSPAKKRVRMVLLSELNFLQKQALTELRSETASRTFKIWRLMHLVEGDLGTRLFVELNVGLNSQQECVRFLDHERFKQLSPFQCISWHLYPSRVKTDPTLCDFVRWKTASTKCKFDHSHATLSKCIFFTKRIFHSNPYKMLYYKMTP